MLSAVARRSFRKRLVNSAAIVQERQRSWFSWKKQGMIASRPMGPMESDVSRSFPVHTFNSVASLDYFPPPVHDQIKSKSLILYEVSPPQKKETNGLDPLLRSSSVQDQQQHPTSTFKAGEEEDEDGLIVNVKHDGTIADTSKHDERINNDTENNEKLERERKNNIKTSKFYHQQVILGKLKRALAATKVTGAASNQNKYGLETNHRLIQSLFHQATKEQIDLTPDLYSQCFQSFVQHNHLWDAIEALHGWIALSKAASKGSNAVPLPSEKIFLLLIDALGNNAKLPRHRQIQGRDGLYGIIEDLILMIQSNFPNESSSVKQQTLPRLLCNIVQYTANDHYLTGIAQKLYRYLMRRERHYGKKKHVTSKNPSPDAALPPLLIPFDPQIFKEILHHSANQGACYLPVIEILYALVFDHDITVDAETVMKLLQKEYPFLDMDRIVLYLDCIEKLSSETSTSGALTDDYRIDIGLLEQIMMQAARRKLPDVIRRGWNLMERYQYYPTESMYESSMHAFFLSYKSDHFGFAIMKEMEYQSGYIPSYALIRTVSNCIRTTAARIDNAYNYILASKAHNYITISSMNCILSAYGQAGCIESAFATFDDLLEHGINPDSNSFAFLLEALSTHVQSCRTKERSEANEHGISTTEETNLYTQEQTESEIFKGEDEELMYQQQPQPFVGTTSKTTELNAMDFTSFIEAANGILDMMDERGIQMDHRILHQYIRLLVFAGETERAKGILEETLAEGAFQIRLETLSLVSFQLAVFEGKLEMGREVANMILKSGYRQIPTSLQKRLIGTDHIIKST